MLNWNEFFQIILLMALACFASYYEGKERGEKQERKRIVDRYDIKMK
jgi:hypothetical protein